MDTAFDNTRFGQYTNGNYFCDMGIGTCLIKMIQLQATSQGFSLSLFLQANLGSQAAIWYGNRGFERIQNDFSLLPQPLLEYYT